MRRHAQNAVFPLRFDSIQSTAEGALQRLRQILSGRPPDRIFSGLFDTAPFWVVERKHQRTAAAYIEREF